MPVSAAFRGHSISHRPYRRGGACRRNSSSSVSPLCGGSMALADGRTVPADFSQEVSKPSNQSMERTAARFVFSFCVAKTLSLRFMRVLGGGRSSVSLDLDAARSSSDCRDCSRMAWLSFVETRRAGLSLRIRVLRARSAALAIHIVSAVVLGDG